MAPPWFVADHDATEAPTAVAVGDSASKPIFAERERPRASVEEAVDTATTLIFDERTAANSGEEKLQASADGAADSASTPVGAERAAKFKHTPRAIAEEAIDSASTPGRVFLHYLLGVAAELASDDKEAPRAIAELRTSGFTASGRCVRRAPMRRRWVGWREVG